MENVFLILFILVLMGVSVYLIWKRTRKHPSPSPSPSSKPIPWTPQGPSTPVCEQFESSVIGHGPTGTIYPYNKDTNVLGPDSSTLFSASDLVFTQPNATFAFALTFEFIPTNQFAPCTKIGQGALFSKSVLQDLFTFFNTRVVNLTPGCGFYTAKGNIPVLVVPQPIVPTGFVCKVNVLINNKPNGTTMDMYQGPNKTYQIGADSQVYFMSQVNLKNSVSDPPSNMNEVFTFGGCPGDEFKSAVMISLASLQQLLAYLKTWKDTAGAGFYDSRTNQPIAIL